MYDYSFQLEAFHASKIALPALLRAKLFSHRKANRDRLVGRLPRHIPGVSVGESNFYPQGSVAIKTVIQTLFDDEEYDIDDGLVLLRRQVVDEDGRELSSEAVRDRVKAALADARFKKQPVLMTNCVRVFYADEGAAKHHVDIPVYRKWTENDGTSVRELASADGWLESDPTQVTCWFEDEVTTRNKESPGRGTQLRQHVRLVKRFCRSREDWLDLLPNGMKLTMLVAECQPEHHERLDMAFRSLLEPVRARIERSMVIRNLAHPDQPQITRTERDPNVQMLLEKVEAAITKLETLDAEGAGLAQARDAWDWVFQSNGFFDELDTVFQAQNLLDSEQSDVTFPRIPWVEPLPWPVVLRHRVDVSAQHSLGAYGWRSFSSGTPLEKELSLTFKPITDARGDHRIYWQIVNTGAEARRARCMRGEIVEPDDSASSVRTEATAYTGKHWVECFVVQRGVCVARSGPFIVAIQ